AVLLFPLPFLQSLLGLASRNDEMVVFAVASPRARRHIAHFDKLPVRPVDLREFEIIADGGRNTQTSAVISIWLGALVLENVLKMIGEKRAAILPLRVAGAIALANGDPSVLAHRLSWSRVCLLEPRNDRRRFWFELAV